MSSIKFEHIRKVYDNNVEVVKDFNLYIEDKEFVILVGPSGCGKSTTLRMIAGLEDITDGRLYIGDKLVNDTAPKDRDIAMVFQNYALYPHMSVFKNMAFGLELRKTPKEEIKKRVEWAAKVLDISHLLSRKPKALSGGQRQRVALGRAMVRNPSVFLLDEPLSNLDAKLRVQMRTELIKLHKQLQTTFVYVTHDQIEAMTMGTRIVVMKDGDIMQADDAKTLYNNPKNLFVAGFIGAPQMNFINALLNKNNDKWHANFEGYKIELNNDKISKLDNSYNGKEVILGIRPENITLCKDNSLASSSNMMEGVIDVIEMIGSESYLYMKFGNSQIIIRTNSSDDYQREQHVFIEFDLNKIHIFDKDTEENILI
ncbi:ABC transporter ATP-binding protein [uncultured Brachyspira sp.]|uniref:ABC transporter ATP-binding protein n=1 Tax=uncultured Brachyspira sp. TaxID=221953 RepID=UPI002615AB29|nr:ABC transporter ATP-binding protein [uncultured Brachyspira sp.]